MKKKKTKKRSPSYDVLNFENVKMYVILYVTVGAGQGAQGQKITDYVSPTKNGQKLL